MLKQKILFDTDIGDDIDDAMALALALEMPEIEVIGVTTTFLNTDIRARMAKKMLSLWGVDIPVYAGIRHESMGKTANDIPCQYTPDLEDEAYAPMNVAREDNGEAAVDYIIRMADTYADELIIVAVGPLGNIAAALKEAPETMKKVKQIVVMGGCFYGQTSEWNIACDPKAAKVVYGFEGNLASVGLDVTMKACVNYRQFTDLMAAGTDARKEYLITLIKLYNETTMALPVLHDPLTVYYVAHPDALLMEPARVEVETKGEFTTGMTVKFPPSRTEQSNGAKAGQTIVAKDVRAGEFVREYLRIVFKI